MKEEFKSLVLGLLAEHNTQLSQLISIVNSEELADQVNEEPVQRSIQTGRLVRIRTKIAESLWCVVVFDEHGFVVEARLDDEKSGQRMEFRA